MILLDSTLREGEQTPGVLFSTDEKITIAKMLDDFGVEMIEAGHPSVSDDISNAVKKIANEELNAEIVAHVRAIQSDIDKAISCDVNRIAIFFPTSEIHLKDKIRINQEKAIERISNLIDYTCSHGIKVRYTAEDFTRTSLDYAIRAYRTAIEAGADRISITDTVGVAIPNDFYHLVKVIHNSFQVEIDVHCHNDFGLALANALASLRAGANCVHVTINGLGERCGIVDLAQISALWQILFKKTTRYKLEMLPEITNYIENITGISKNPISPIVGVNAFKHKSGVHTDGVIKNPNSYEPFDPELVGKKREILIDQFTGKLAVKTKLKKVGVSLSNEDLHNLINKIKAKTMKKDSLNEVDLLKLINENKRT